MPEAWSPYRYYPQLDQEPAGDPLFPGPWGDEVFQAAYDQGRDISAEAEALRAWSSSPAHARYQLPAPPLRLVLQDVPAWVWVVGAVLLLGGR